MTYGPILEITWSSTFWDLYIRPDGNFEWIRRIDNYTFETTLKEVSDLILRHPMSGKWKWLIN